MAERFIAGYSKRVGNMPHVDNQDETVSALIDAVCGDTCAGSGSTQSPSFTKLGRWQRVAEPGQAQ
ncbi:MAG: hypothetical protein R2865_17820 [Deinococcales bacterium]